MIRYSMHLRNLLLYTMLLAFAGAVRAAAATPTAPACAAPGYRSFDFWLGNWDAYDLGSNVLGAHVRVTSILNGCAIREEYSGVDGARGESLSTYDPAHRIWHQFWVSSTGEIVDLSGNVSDGAMLLTGPEEGQRTLLVRGIWKRDAGGVRETGLRSEDGGQTWLPWFDLAFRPAH